MIEAKLHDPQGRGHVRIDEDRWIVGIRVDQEHQGQGVGRALLERALDLIDGPAFAEVSRDNVSGTQFYEACGFVVDRPGGNDGSDVLVKL